MSHCSLESLVFFSSSSSSFFFFFFFFCLLFSSFFVFYSSFSSSFFFFFFFNPNNNYYSSNNNFVLMSSTSYAQMNSFRFHSKHMYYRPFCIETVNIEKERTNVVLLSFFFLRVTLLQSTTRTHRECRKVRPSESMSSGKCWGRGPLEKSS